MIKRNNKNAVCITVYKHRSTTMLAHLEKINKAKYDVYIVAQENDPSNEEYEQYSGIVLYPNVTNIFEKREYIRITMSELGYDGFFMIDDDVNYEAFKITPESKRTTSDSYKRVACDFNEMLDKMVDTAYEYNAGYVCNMRIGYLGWQKPNTIKINKGLNVAQFGYFRLDKMNEHNLHYDTSGYINEDFDMTMQFLQHGVNCITVCDYAFTTSNIMYKNMNTTTLYENLETNYKLVIHKYIKYHVPLFLDTKGFLRSRCAYNKYFNTFDVPEADPVILEMCKTDNIQGLIDYLIATGRNKMRIG